MTSASSLHFGPEWMRKPSRGSLAPLSPNTAGGSPGMTTNMLPTPPAQTAPQLPSVSSYSSLLTSSPPPQIRSEDENYPFRYSKEQLLRVWRDGGGRGGLGLEVERWPGIVREVGGEPLGMKEMTPEERKLFSNSVNSDPPIRRNANALALSSDRQGNKLGGIGLGPTSPRGIGVPRRRGTGNTEDLSSAPFLPRKLSLSSNLLSGSAGINTPNSPGGPLSSPNTRNRFSGLDTSDAADGWARGPSSSAADSAWSVMGARRRTNEGGMRGRGGASGPNMGLGIGRGISFGSLTHDGVSGNGSIDEKISPSVSPGPAPVSNAGAVVSAEEASQLGGPIDGGEVSQPAIATSTIYATNGAASVAPTLAREPTEDLANIQWSYKDPTGQIQGPFAGATMQQWFETGYFSDDLLIKRTTVDLEFEPLRDFRRRAPPLRPGETHIQMFLSPLAPRAPPNLPPPQAHLRENAPPNPSLHSHHMVTGMHDLSNHGSMPPTINGDGSVPPAARSTTLGPYPTSPHDQPGQNGFVGSPLTDGLVAGAGRAGLTNVELERKKREEFIQSLRERELAMGVGVPSPQPFGSTGPFGAGFIPNPSAHSQYPAFAPSNPSISSMFSSRINVPMPPAPIPIPVSNAALSIVSPFPQNAPVLWSSGEQPNTSAPYGTPGGAHDHGTIYQSTPNQVQQNVAWQDGPAHQERAWESIPEHHSLPLAVETAANVAEESAQTLTSDTQIHESPSSSHPLLSVGADPYLANDVATAPEGAMDRIHTETSPGPEAAAPELDSEPVSWPEPEPEPEPEVESETWSEYEPEPEHEHELESKATPAPPTAPSEDSPIAPNKSDNASTSSATKPSVPRGVKSPVSAPAKAWAVDGDKPSPSLREIQQAETRKAEAREAAKKSAKVNPAPPSKPSVVSPTATEPAVAGSWGLPQVGARSNAPPAATAVANGPAWTKTPVGKKSMKEIQEEEEKRKKAVAAKEAQAAAAAQAAKRAANGPVKSAPPTGGAWTTVGPQGKQTAPSAVVRQPTRTASSGAPPHAPVRSSTSTSVSVSQAPAKPATPDETPAPPSLDFLKWLKEALKGLNGVNVEEFMQMLLSFPLDPSPTVIEIISDSIYANSSTLDGRRFAAEFCQKRKADAAAARTKPGSAPGAKVPRTSLAEVVKTQPKPVQSDWGFKTVQKKAKGGRK